jgi:hypothetical protein
MSFGAFIAGDVCRLLDAVHSMKKADHNLISEIRE